MIKNKINRLKYKQALLDNKFLPQVDAADHPIWYYEVTLNYSADYYTRDVASAGIKIADINKKTFYNILYITYTVLFNNQDEKGSIYSIKLEAYEEGYIVGTYPLVKYGHTWLMLLEDNKLLDEELDDLVNI